MNVILASQSPRRKQILEDAGIVFEIVTATTEENFPETMSLHDAPEHIAKEKAHAVKALLQAQHKWNDDTVIIAADTVVLLDNALLGKPKDAADAKNMLAKLSGKKHEVITGVYMCNKAKEYSFKSTTAVHFNELSTAQIDYYIQHFKPFDKAGSYAIQEWIGLIGIHKIEGDMYNVIGLPINKLVKAIEEFNT